jgi:ATP-binding protein involved in chromosome partitioning
MTTEQNEQLITLEEDKKRQQEAVLRSRMQQVRRKLIVLSGKGGVGKSTVAANLAFSFAREGRTVGLLDVDIHGPSIPMLTGLEGSTLHSEAGRILPARARDRLWVMSIGFLLGRQEDAIIWRGPLKYGVIRQFLGDVDWGPLDYLVVDCPPGTGDEPLSVVQLAGRPAWAVVVTTPQELALSDVRRCVTFCEKTSLPVAGILENMSGCVCPQCGAEIDLFGRGGGERLAREMNVPYLGRIPVDPAIVACGDRGVAFVEGETESPASSAFREVVRKIEENTETGG